MKLSSIVKSVIVGAAITAGCGAAPLIAEETQNVPEVIQEVEQTEVVPQVEGNTKDYTVKDASILLESSSETQGETNALNLAGIFSIGGKPYAKLNAFQMDDFSQINYGLRGYLDLNGFKGSAELIGVDNSDSNNGIGINARGGLDNLKFGLALERMIESGDSKNLASIYSSIKLGDFDTSIGIADVDEEVLYKAAVKFTLEQHLFGGALTSNDEGDGYLTLVTGMAPEKSGEGFGYRSWAKIDSEGNYVIDFLGSTGSTISHIAIGAVAELENGWHDSSLFANKFDSSIYLWERTAAGLVVNANFSDIGDVKSLNADAIYQFSALENGFAPRIGAGYSAIGLGDDVTQAGRINAGFTWKQFYLDLTGKGIDGEKPTFGLTAGGSFKF